MAELELRPIRPDLPDGPTILDARIVGDQLAWLRANKDDLLIHLSSCGGILIRGLLVKGPEDFERIAGNLIGQWMGYQDRASKRSAVCENVFTSTDTPAEFAIPLHNESSFTERWPQKIFFCCQLVAKQGGRTPIADTRMVYDTLDTALRSKFEQRGVMYVRNFGRGLGMDWRDVFQVANRDELEQYCASAGIRTEWSSDGHLRTFQVRPATLRHPQTGANVWFNHAMALHSSSLDTALRATLLRQHGEENLPHHTYYGDGEPIPDAAIEKIREAYDQATCWFDWQPGDVLILDNQRCAHGREPYTGQRRVFAAMADPRSWSETGFNSRMPEADPRIAQPQSEAAWSNGTAPIQQSSGELRAWFYAAVAQQVDIDNIEGADNFKDIGGSSLSAVALVEEVYDRFGIELDIESLLNADSLEDVVKLLEND